MSKEEVHIPKPWRRLQWAGAADPGYTIDFPKMKGHEIHLHLTKCRWGETWGLHLMSTYVSVAKADEPMGEVFQKASEWIEKILHQKAEMIDSALELLDGWS